MWWWVESEESRVSRLIVGDVGDCALLEGVLVCWSRNIQSSPDCKLQLISYYFHLKMLRCGIPQHPLLYLAFLLPLILEITVSSLLPEQKRKTRQKSSWFISFTIRNDRSIDNAAFVDQTVLAVIRSWKMCCHDLKKKNEWERFLECTLQNIPFSCVVHFRKMTTAEIFFHALHL